MLLDEICLKAFNLEMDELKTTKLYIPASRFYLHFLYIDKRGLKRNELGSSGGQDSGYWNLWTFYGLALSFRQLGINLVAQNKS